VPAVRDLLLREYRPRSLLKVPEHVPERARFPVIDAHNHLFGDIPAERIVRVMDRVGVRVFVNVTGNCSLPFDEQGYTIRRRDLAEFRSRYMDPYPGRFSAFTMSEFAQWDDFVLFKSRDFVDVLIQRLEEDVRVGAKGLKVTKELGLRFTDREGSLLPVDEPRLWPVWRRAGELDIPVLIHVSDPVGFFLPVDESNEHYLTLRQYPGWSFRGSRYSKEELLAQRDRMMARHLRTRFICPHVANNPEDLAAVARLLEELPNVYLDFSARIDELGRQPYSARDFMIRYQDRILFGTDMPVSPEVYRCYFRFLESRDEFFDYPNYVGEWGSCRWKIYGLHLPDETLQKIYYQNALRVIPGIEGF
jgi:predicted TIM-barrel fold metal-dependent hydrolase